MPFVLKDPLARLECAFHTFPSIPRESHQNFQFDNRKSRRICSRHKQQIMERSLNTDPPKCIRIYRYSFDYIDVGVSHT